MEHSETVAKIAEALAAAQAEMMPAKHDSENPHFRMRYASLASVTEAVKPLARHGIAVVQGVRVVDDPTTPSVKDATHYKRVEVTTLLAHTSGEWVKDTLSLRPREDNPQAVGSAYTYGRRYLLAGLAGIAADEDDDGNGATEPPRRGPGRPRAEERQASTPPPAKAPPLPPPPATPPRGVPVGTSTPSTPPTNAAATPTAPPAKREATPEQKAMTALLRELGITDKAAGRVEISKLVGRELASVSELTPAETDQVLFALRGAVNAQKRQPDENQRAVIEKIRAAAVDVGEDAEIFAGSILERKVERLSDLTDDDRAVVLYRLQTLKADAARAAETAA